MGHARATDRLDQCFLDDSILNIKAQLAGSLLGRTPAYAMGKTAYIFLLLSLGSICLPAVLVQGRDLRLSLRNTCFVFPVNTS